MKDTKFAVTLVPHRSLGPRGFFIVMSLICAISFAAGLFFFLLGAWPVVGFFGLDVVLIYAAFKWTYHTGKQQERVEITDSELLITYTSARGVSQNWRFDRYWVRIEHVVNEKDVYDNPPLILTSHGRQLEIGRFLPRGQKTKFAAVLRDALQPG